MENDDFITQKGEREEAPSLLINWNRISSKNGQKTFEKLLPEQRQKQTQQSRLNLKKRVEGKKSHREKLLNQKKLTNFQVYRFKASQL